MGTFSSTAYGPPWGGIQGTGTTAGGTDLTDGKKAYIVAVDPDVIPLGTHLLIWPNPFQYRGAFLADDTGGAIQGNRIDFYDWRGRATQTGWGVRDVRVSKSKGNAEITGVSSDSGGGGLPGPLGDIGDTAQAVGDLASSFRSVIAFIARLWTPAFWLRVGKALFGTVCLIFGITVLSKALLGIDLGKLAGGTANAIAGTKIRAAKGAIGAAAASKGLGNA